MCFTLTSVLSNHGWKFGLTYSMTLPEKAVQVETLLHSNESWSSRENLGPCPSPPRRKSAVLQRSTKGLIARNACDARPELFLAMPSSGPTLDQGANTSLTIFTVFGTKGNEDQGTV